METVTAEMRVGGIGNIEGGLHVQSAEGKYYWGIENWNGTRWEEIPESLYNALVKFEKNRGQENQERITMNAREELIVIAAEAVGARDAAASLLDSEMRTNDLLGDQLAQQKRQAERDIEELRLQLESTNKELVDKMHEVWSLEAWQSGEVRGLANLLDAMSGSIDNDNEPEWLKMAVAGEKIAAIKLIRSTEHYSLLFCKNLVELIMALAKYWEVE